MFIIFSITGLEALDKTYLTRQAASTDTRRIQVDHLRDAMCEIVRVGSLMKCLDRWLCPKKCFLKVDKHDKPVLSKSADVYIYLYIYI